MPQPNHASPFATGSTELDSEPIPPRFLWLKRVLVASAALLLLLVVVR
jgi:hypothetical protein